ncbi:serine/threonine-protein kinase [Nonomuraea sp. ATR24]|uniref:serine/threonine-protein kinase n=1 Tax=Nonomuraea sp. ATR24 TaxID=1676744 RepID=UPI0035C01617
MEAQQRVGPYVLLRKLGEGGMGFVHLARDGSGRQVALKMMRPELAAREEFRRRFGKEAEAARRVARFCTAPVLDAGFDGGTAYLVTEFVEGPDLAGVIRRHGPMTGSNLEALAVGVATALAAIHQAGVVHRDLKPSNVLLSPVGPRVIDFGIAQLADTADLPFTVAQSMGTPAYMSPEQARGEPVTPAGDVFAWGALMAYAGTGRPPFGTGGVAEVVYRVVNHAPVLDGLDERIRSLVERALDKDPARRPTAQQLLDRLLGRTEVQVDAATRVVSETWTPVLAPAGGAPAASYPASSFPASSFPAGPGGGNGGGNGDGRPGPGPAGRRGGAAGRGRRWVPVVTALLAAAVGAGVTVAVLRPWEQAAGEPGTPAAASTIDALGSRLSVQVDSLVRQGGTVRLQWTVKNVGEENAPLAGKLGRGALDSTASRVSLVPPGVGSPIYPASKDGGCDCTDLPVAPFQGGDQVQLYAIYANVPEDVARVDVDMGPLGVIRNVAITPS